MRLVAFVSAGIILSSSSVFGAASDLDIPFGIGGIARIDFAGGNDDGQDVAVQPDGGIVVVGRANALDFAVARLTPDGNLDSGFGTGGVVVTSFGVPSYALKVALRPDGRIIVGGNFSSVTNHFAVAQYLPNGTLDTSFGTGGLVQITISGTTDNLQDLTLQPDGKVILAGGTYQGSGDSVLVRLTSDGMLDSGFGTGGIAIHDAGAGQADYLFAVALQSDGKIIAGGRVNRGFPTYEDFLLVRYATDGTLDTTFGTNGIVATEIDGNANVIKDIVIAPDDKIVVCGESNTGFAVARYDANGSLDPSFGVGGFLTHTVAGTTNTEPDALALDGAGRIVVAGVASNGSNLDFAIARYLGDGTLDPAFGTGGIVITPASAVHDSAHAVAIQSDGKIVAAGDGSSDFTVVRYVGDGVGPAGTPTRSVTPTNTATATPTPTGGSPTVSPTGTGGSGTQTPLPTFGTLCTSGPISPCKVSGFSQFAIRNNADDAKDKLKFKWSKGETTTFAELGDPTTNTQYSLCAWDFTADDPSLVMEAVIPAGGNCNGKPCWRPIGTNRGFKFRDSGLLPNGIQKVVLKTGSTGRSAASIKGRGTMLPDIPMPVNQDTKFVVQLVNSAGSCWGVDFVTTATKNTGTSLVLKEKP